MCLGRTSSYGRAGPPTPLPIAPVEAEEVIKRLVATTNETRGSVLSVLSELDVILEEALKAGRRVNLPNGTTFRPVGKKDGSISVKVYLGKRMTKSIAAEQHAQWINAQNIGKSQAEMIQTWNKAHPDNLIDD